MRFLSPSIFLLGLVLLPLPWIEVQCVARSNPGFPEPRVGVARQNGIQTMTGDSTTTAEYKRTVEQSKKNLRKDTLEIIEDRLEPQRADPAILVIGWTALLVLGAAVGFLMRAGRMRTGLLMLIGLAAFACLLLQGLVVGFPLKPAIERTRRGEDRSDDSARAEPPEKDSELRFETVLGPLYWLAAAVPLAALVGAFFEATRAPVRRSRDDDDVKRACYPSQAVDPGASSETGPMISYRCPECSCSLLSRQEAAGMTIRCRECKMTIVVSRPRLRDEGRPLAVSPFRARRRDRPGSVRQE
jgi:DNA-directed RNA polymerase subunit RPC12/RpoP